MLLRLALVFIYFLFYFLQRMMPSVALRERTLEEEVPCSLPWAFGRKTKYTSNKNINKISWYEFLTHINLGVEFPDTTENYQEKIYKIL